MTTVFNTTPPDPALGNLDRWIPTLNAWRSDPASDMGLKAMARNIAHEPRLSGQRIDDFHLYATKPGSAPIEEVQAHLENYQRDNVRGIKRPDFVDARVNRENLAMRAGPALSGRRGYPLVHPHIWLGRVINLNGLALALAQRAAPVTAVVQELRSKLPPRVHPAAGRPLSLTTVIREQRRRRRIIRDWLRGKLEGGVRTEQRNVIEGLFEEDAYWQRRGSYYQPAWATTWDVLEPVAHQSPDRWAQGVGLLRPELGDWLILVKYLLPRGKVLVRPTQLEAGWYDHHFPSPISSAHPVQGHPVDQCIRPPAVELQPEFIHLQLPLEIEWWDDGGFHCKQVRRRATRDPAQARLTHWELLQREYDPVEVTTWMPSPS
jgi:hypothetical protein